MNDLVTIKSEQVITTSLKIAEVFEKEHFHVLRDIEEIVAQLTAESALALDNPNLDFPNVQEMFQKSSYKVEGQTRRYPMYYLNRDGYSLLVMGFTGPKALQFKMAYIAAFNRMEKILLERQTPEWQDARDKLTEATKELMQVIHDELIPLAIRQGMEPHKKRHFYSNYNRLINRLTEVVAGTRNLLPFETLFEMRKMTDMVAAQISDYVAAEIDYHEIYQRVKVYLEGYAKFSTVRRLR